MLRYYIDEHLSAAIAEQLRARGVDLIRAHDVGRVNRKIPDDEQLAYATGAEHVLVSIDRDFTRLNSAPIPHAGIIVLQWRLGVGKLVEYLELMAKTIEPEELRNTLVYCNY